MRNRFNTTTKRSRGSAVWDLLLPVCFFALIIAFFFHGVGSISQTADQERLRSAQNAVTKAAVQCYALEGQYPPDLNYLRDNYGLSIDERVYIVHYDMFASNIMPQITVLPRVFLGGNANE